MPNRVIREGIRTSERVNKLEPLTRWLFVTLMTAADDFGRFHANPLLVAGNCLPFDGQAPDKVQSMLNGLASAELIALYEVEGRAYLEIKGFNQRTRAKSSKYPAPSDGSQVTVICPSSAHGDGDGDGDGDVIMSDSDESDAMPSAEYCKDRWNEIAERHQWLSSIQRMSAKRMNKLSLRLREYPDFWTTIEDKANDAGPFLKESNWFNLDWLIQNDTNYLKFAEGKYDGSNDGVIDGE